MFKKLSPWLVVVLASFLIDRWLKYWFIKNPSAVIGEGFFGGLSFGLAKNPGIAFGFNFNRTALIIITIILILILMKLLIKSFIARSLVEVVGFSLIVVGAFSNLIDRIQYGFVIDYIDISWFTVFNIADSAITIGVITLIMASFSNSRTRQN